jgi:hypothetical protein
MDWKFALPPSLLGPSVNNLLSILNYPADDGGIVFHDDVPRVADRVGEHRKLYTRDYPTRP